MRIQIPYLIASVFCIFILFGLLAYAKDYDAQKEEDLQIPEGWLSSYSECADDYETYTNTNVDWSKEEPDVEEYVAMSIPVETYSAGTATTPIILCYQSATDIELATLSDTEAWILLSNGIFDSYPKQPYRAIADKLETIRNENTVTITVPCWYWANPSDDSDFTKTTIEKTFAVNTALKDTFLHIFNDIYAAESQPIINIADKGMGTWVLRGKNHNSNNTMSAHSIGGAIDINPSTGSFCVNGKWYGNAYNQSAMPTYIWEQLPECHKKYHVLYADSDIVKIFKAYGFIWGGDWSSGTDPMHFSYIGDGASARVRGTQNFNSMR